MIYRSLKQGYKYELEVNVVIFSSFLGFFLFLLFREFFPQGGSNSSPEFLRSPVKTILNRSQGHRCRHRDPSISPEMLRSQVVSLQHRAEQDPKVILRVSWNIEFPNPSLSHRLFNLNKKTVWQAYWESFKGS